jgi:competence protein CoiA
MIVAKTKNDELVVAAAAERAGKYTCPSCGSIVRLKVGEIKMPHFAHASLEECASFSEGETAEHLTGKIQLAQYFLVRGFEVDMERWLPEINQRPDLLVIKNGDTFAIEYQCAPISLNRVRERTEGYREMGMRVYWVLGQPYQHRLSKATRAKFCQIVNGKLAILFWRTGHKRMVAEPWLTTDGVHRIGQSCSELTLQRQNLMIAQGVPRRDEFVMHWQRVLYMKHKNITGLPWVCHPVHPISGGPKEPNWSMILRVLLALSKGPLSVLALKNAIQKGSWQSFGVVPDKVAQQIWLTSLLREWIRIGVCHKVGKLFELNEQPVWYPDYCAKANEVGAWFQRAR